MPALPPGDFHLAAHEYAHVLIRSAGLRLPRWIAEGISEVASTVRIGDRSSSVGGDLPARSQFLRRMPWLPPAELFRRGEQDGDGGDVFYAESWALTQMLMLSPQYAPGFRLLVGSLAAGADGEAALRAAYRLSAETVIGDLRAWVARIPAPVPLAGVGTADLRVEAVVLSTTGEQSMLADLRYALGDLDGAAAIYRALVSGSAGSDVYASLGVVELRRGHRQVALRAWERAMELGVMDAAVCYRYAMLADLNGVPSAQVRRALERALALRPGFDDAHYQLALMLHSAGEAEAAITHLRAMRTIADARAVSYWSVMANALLDLGRRDEARAAALKVRAAATSEDERQKAERIVLLADTELIVQLTSGPDGPHFQTVRVPLGQSARNPFIEEGDGIRRMEATLRTVECADDGIRIGISSKGGELVLSVPDPSRVQIRNTPGVAFEFVCGPQKSQAVLVEYTSGNVLRGLELR
jgi:tetratricopeptide (TPR) repeat protein